MNKQDNNFVSWPELVKCLDTINTKIDTNILEINNRIESKFKTISEKLERIQTYIAAARFKSRISEGIIIAVGASLVTLLFKKIFP